MEKFISHLKKMCTINWKMVPLKLLIFLWSSAAFSILPYLTIHMKDIGISIDHIALIYAILPFTIFVAPPAVGFLADKLGSFTRVLFLTLLGTGIFHTALLFIPTSLTVGHPPSETKFSLVNETGTLMWTPCNLDQIKVNNSDIPVNCIDENKDLKIKDTGPIFGPNYLEVSFDLILKSCSLTCPTDSIQLCESLSNMMICSENKEEELVTLRNISLKLMENQRPQCSNLKFINVMSRNRPLMIAPGCKLECAIEEPLPFDNYKNMCSTKEGDTRLTLALYFVFRALATMCLACCFILIDAQTIQMCKEEELNGRKGALGKQYVFQAISQAIISPVIGQLMDLVSKTYNDGKPNYLVPFISHDVFLLVGMVLLIFTDLNVQLPKSTGFKGMKKIFSSLDVCVFLVLMFVIGSLWGFIETFLFVYLKDDMSAPMYLLGLTITVGAVVSIPFLYIADYLVDRIGRNNTFIIALLMYSVRYVGYSYITNPWHAFPFEALELFTINLFKVACVQYVGEKSPPGLLATLNGISGCIHYGLGKGSGSLIGGYVISITGSTALTFRYFGIAAAVAGFLYFLYDFGYVKGLKCISQSNNSVTNKDYTLKDEKTITTSEPLIHTENKPIIITRESRISH